MTKYDLQLLFEDKAGLLMTDSTKMFKTSEIERFLNQAQDKHFAYLAKRFEIDEDARRALSELVKDEVLSEMAVPPSITPLSTDSMFFDIKSSVTDDMYKIVDEFIKDGSSKRIPVKPVTHDQYSANIDNPYKQPYNGLVWRIDVDGVVELIPIDVSTPINYNYRYLQRPLYIDFTDTAIATLQLRNKDLKIIVDIAVEMAINSLNVVKSRE